MYDTSAFYQDFCCIAKWVRFSCNTHLLKTVEECLGTCLSLSQTKECGRSKISTTLYDAQRNHRVVSQVESALI